jgi:hypothetical protein
MSQSLKTGVLYLEIVSFSQDAHVDMAYNCGENFAGDLNICAV